jgi:hypothetical protein
VEYGERKRPEHLCFRIAQLPIRSVPVAFDELLSVTAALLQIRDEPPASTEEAIGGAQLASGEDVAWQVEKRIFLERLWAERIFLKARVHHR